MWRQNHPRCIVYHTFLTIAECLQSQFVRVYNLLTLPDVYFFFYIAAGLSSGGSFNWHCYLTVIKAFFNINYQSTFKNVITCSLCIGAAIFFSCTYHSDHLAFFRRTLGSRLGSNSAYEKCSIWAIWRKVRSSVTQHNFGILWIIWNIRPIQSQVTVIMINLSLQHNRKTFRWFKYLGSTV